MSQNNDLPDSKSKSYVAATISTPTTSLKMDHFYETKKFKSKSAYRLSSSNMCEPRTDPVQLKAIRLYNATENLRNKRIYFSEKMNDCKERRLRLQKEVEGLEQRQLKTRNFVIENDSKRWRALQKFCADNQLCSVRKKEKQHLSSELRKAKLNYVTLNSKATELRKYEKFLLQVVRSLPKDYIKLADDAIVGLIMRYNTLYETNQNLKKEMETKSEELRQAQLDLRRLIDTHRFILFGKNSELSALYSRRERMNDLYQGTQQSLLHNHDELSNQLSVFSTVIRSINNLTGKLLRLYDPNLNGSALTNKIQKMNILSRCQFIEDHISSVRNVLVHIITEQGVLPMSTCCRPHMTSEKIAAILASSPNEFTILSKLNSIQNG